MSVLAHKLEHSVTDVHINLTLIMMTFREFVNVDLDSLTFLDNVSEMANKQAMIILINVQWELTLI